MRTVVGSRDSVIVIQENGISLKSPAMADDLADPGRCVIEAKAHVAQQRPIHNHEWAFTQVERPSVP
jgi:hypothetical protein